MFAAEKPFKSFLNLGSDSELSDSDLKEAFTMKIADMQKVITPNSLAWIDYGVWSSTRNGERLNEDDHE